MPTKPAKPTRSAKRKKISYEIIDRFSEVGAPIYALLDELVESVDSHREHLTDARIALAWFKSWKPDSDGRLTLGKCKKASDLDRELAHVDIVIILNKPFWFWEETTDEQRVALLDHELCHARLKHDDNGLPIQDTRERFVYRTRKHDIEEFKEIIERRGVYTKDLEEFFAARMREPLPPFEPCRVECELTPGFVMRTNDEGQNIAHRCGCYTQWKAFCDARRAFEVGELQETR